MQLCGDDGKDYKNKNKNSLLYKIYRNTLETSIFSTLKSRKV